MIRLDTYQRKLQAVLGGAVTTSQPTVVVSYTDIENENQKKFFVETVTSVLNSTNPVDILPAPDKAMVREVDSIHIRNNDTVAATVTVRINDNGTNYELVEVTLQAGETLVYTDSEGWKVFTKYGNTASVFNYIDFNQNAPAPGAEGRLYWDSGDGSLTLGLKGGNSALQLGQENVAFCYNGSGSTITNGSVVAVSGAQGQRPKVVLADADTEPLSAATLGIATEDILNGEEGFVCTFGLVRGIDTSGFTAGDPIYLSQTAGKFTATRPLAPAHTVFLGWVIKVNANSGEVFVHISNGWELEELHNVLISSPLDGQVLTYEQSTSLWKNVALPAGVSSFSAGTTGLTPNTATTGAVTLAGTLGTGNGGTGLTSFTANGVVYASNTTTLATGSSLVFDGSNLGIGTTAAGSYSLDIFRTTNAFWGMRVRNTNSGASASAAIQFGNDTNGAAAAIILYSSANVSGIGGANALSIIQGLNAPIVLATNSAERMRIDGSGNVGIGRVPTYSLDVNSTARFNTTIGVGNTAPAASGAGISFPATQSASSDANTLDDYEESTWTPTDGSGAGLTFTNVTARYTKIGNVVTVFAKLTYPTTASGLQAKIDGLPFAATDGGQLMYCSSSTTTTGFGQGYIVAGTTTATLVTQTSATRANSQLSTLVLYFTGTYLI